MQCGDAFRSTRSRVTKEFKCHLVFIFVEKKVNPLQTWQHFVSDKVKVISECVYRKEKVALLCVYYLALLWLGDDDLAWLESGGGGGCSHLLALLLPLHLYCARLLRQREVVLHRLCRGNRLTHLLLHTHRHIRMKPITMLHLHQLF